MTANHADHFLSRLDRLDTARTEFALELYRNHEHTRGLLQRIEVSEGAQRIALALQEGPDPPFVLVTRDGKFVTCLAEGMQPTGCHVVPYHRVATLWERLFVLHDRNRRQGGEGRTLIHRIYHAGPTLSQEDFQALAAIEPIERESFRTIFSQVFSTLRECLAVVPRLTGKNDEEIKLLRGSWKLVHATSHLAMLTSIGEEKAMVGALTREERSRITPAGVPFALENVVGTLRGFNAVARAGKAMLGPYQDLLASADSQTIAFHAGFGLLALGARQQKNAEEVRKTLSSSNAYNPALPAETRTLCREMLSEYAAALLTEGTEFTRKALQPMGVEMLQKRLRRLGVRESDVAECTAELVPENVLYGYLACGVFEATPLPILDYYNVVATMLPWAVRAKPEELYLPLQFLQTVRLHWGHQVALKMFEPTRIALRNLKPTPVVRATEKLGRNDPCSCGSQKKFKKCCG